MNDFRVELLKDISFFHQLYAKYHDPEWLEIAKNVGIAVDNFLAKEKIKV